MRERERNRDGYKCGVCRSACAFLDTSELTWMIPVDWRRIQNVITFLHHPLGLGGFKANYFNLR